jgi:hypothetical protein
VRRAAEADVTLAARAAELAAANSSRTERLAAAREAGGVAQVGQAGRQGLSCPRCLRSRCVLYMCEQLPDRIEKAMSEVRFCSFFGVETASDYGPTF